MKTNLCFLTFGARRVAVVGGVRQVACEVAALAVHRAVRVLEAELQVESASKNLPAKCLRLPYSNLLPINFHLCIYNNIGLWTEQLDLLDKSIHVDVEPKRLPRAETVEYLGVVQRELATRLVCFISVHSSRIALCGRVAELVDTAVKPHGDQRPHSRDGNGPGRPRAGPGRAWESRPAGLTGRNGPKYFLFKSPLCNGKSKFLLMFYKFY